MQVAYPIVQDLLLNVEIKIGVSVRIVQDEYRVQGLFSGHQNKVYTGWRFFEGKLLPRIKQVVYEGLGAYWLRRRI